MNGIHGITVLESIKKKCESIEPEFKQTMQQCRIHC